MPTLLAGSGIDCVVLDLVMANLDRIGVLVRLCQTAIKVPVIAENHSRR